MADKDGGPAFPTSELIEGEVALTGGMSLRDYFKAKVLPQAWACFTDNGRYTDDNMLERVARECGRMADAMLAEKPRG